LKLPSESGGEQEPHLREAVFDDQFKADLLYRKRTDPRLAKRLIRIANETLASPFTGIAKPEPLREGLQGYWSRRLTREHRIVYRVTDTSVRFASARFHYRSR
jgi:toxin YoeB